MSAPQSLRSLHSHLYGSAALPVLEELFKDTLAMYPLLRDQLARVVAYDRDIWQSSELHGMELFNEVQEGEDYTYDRAKQGASKTLTIKKMGRGFHISDEMIEDGKFNLVADMTQMLARSAKESQQVDFMNLFNNGFSSETTADGLSIFNSAHTLPSGGTYSNILTTAADLSPDSLDQALSDFSTRFVEDGGIVQQLRPKYLVVYESNRRYAKELVASDLKPDSADNNINSLKDEGLIVVSSPHLSDTDAWFLVGDKMDNGLRVVSRRGITTKSHEVFDNDSVKYKASYREKVGCIHPKAIYGTAGA